MSLSDFFKTQHIKRASARRHKPCPTHGKIRRVCNHCTKVYCPRCGHPCSADARQIPDRRGAYSPTTKLRPLWSLVKPLGAIRIDAHEDADAWKVLFPPHTLGVNTAGELADKLWSRADLNALGTPTAFRAGRGIKPSHWWVSILLKEKETK